MSFMARHMRTDISALFMTMSVSQDADRRNTRFHSSSRRPRPGCHRARLRGTPCATFRGTSGKMASASRRAVPAPPHRRPRKILLRPPRSSSSWCRSWPAIPALAGFQPRRQPLGPVGALDLLSYAASTSTVTWASSRRCEGRPRQCAGGLGLVVRSAKLAPWWPGPSCQTWRSVMNASSRSIALRTSPGRSSSSGT